MSAKFTREQIEARLKALDQYEMSLHFLPDEGDLTTREMLRIVAARSKLREMLTNGPLGAAQIENGPATAKRPDRIQPL